MDQHPHYHWGNAAHAQPQAAHPPGHDQSAAVPKSPARLTAQVYQNNHASLQWGASKGADGYIILRGSQPATMQPIAAVAERAFVDTTTQPGRTYFYCISGYNRHGKSRPCDYASVTLPPAHQHMQPSCMSAPPHAPMPHQYAPQPQFAPPHAPMQPHPQMPSQPQMPMHPSMPSHPPEPPTPPLQAPAQLCAFAHGSRYIALRWQSLHSDVQYRVFRSESPWSGYAMVGETGDTHYLDAAPEPMTKYYYFVQAVHNGRTSQASAMAEAQSLPALPTPEMPQNLRCIPQDNDSVELRWNAANAASAYVVYARYDPAEDFSIIGHALDCSFLHKDLPPDAYVEYCVQAYHDSAASEPTPICVCGGRSTNTPSRNSNKSNPNPSKRYPNLSWQGFK